MLATCFIQVASIAQFINLKLSTNQFELTVFWMEGETSLETKKNKLSCLDSNHDQDNGVYTNAATLKSVCSFKFSGFNSPLQ